MLFVQSIHADVQQYKTKYIEEAILIKKNWRKFEIIMVFMVCKR